MTFTDEQIREHAEALEHCSARIMAVLRDTDDRYAVLGIIATSYVVIMAEIRGNVAAMENPITRAALNALANELHRFLRMHLGAAGLDFEASTIQ